MSELKTKIQEQIKAAMKAREQKTLTTLRGLSAAIKQVEVDNRTEVDDEQIVGLIQKEVKKRRDAIGFAEKEGRSEMVAENEEEIRVLQQFLGEQLSEAQLEDIIRGLVGEGADSIGKIMGALNQNYKGQFEGKVASRIANAQLAGK